MSVTASDDATATCAASSATDPYNAKCGGTDLMRLSYSSQLAAKTPEEAQQILASIFAQSLRNNPAREIGGVLYFDPNNVGITQILEGTERELEALFQVISRDPRHFALTVLSKECVTARRFKHFGMNTGLIKDGNVFEELGNIDWGEKKADTCVHGGNFWHFINARRLIRLVYSSQLVSNPPLSCYSNSPATSGQKLVSTSTAAGYEVIEGILRTAIPNNWELKIGGCLFYNESMQLLQVIEGPSADVRELYTKIERDERHTSVSLLSDEPVEARRFSGWGMHQEFIKVSPEEWLKAFRAELDVSQPTGHAGVNTNTGDQAASAQLNTENTAHTIVNDSDDWSVVVVQANKCSTCVLL
eukprot:CAMPEP_0119316066 /NCGR_PEP_ID=MMETSP1333-20130426/38398_1 /TAXON_ID=418940 /ORGANISM="Scyphosphaera apsteinii, Strain RCC1455" /LENGTH=358 /DNA_ID=CAMNT_0007321611 /DNA_START=60 /DNA_END=1136 /DNA_ORIENTATION=-